MLKRFSIALILLFSTLAGAANFDAFFKSHYNSLQEFYRDLHRHPELSGKESRTAAKVAAEFKRLGLETLTDVGGGVVGILKNGPGPVTLVRSETDALPVAEETNLSYKSENAGVMHACAHDLHTTALIGTIEAMIEEKANWRGTLIFIAQPAEEIVKGAKSMIDAGLFKKIPKPDNCIALHTRGALPSGKIGFTRAGPMMAAVDSVDVIIRGVGTHGASPHNGIDSIVLASEFVVKMQILVGREVDPIEPALITVGSFHSGTKHNIIPPEAKLQLTVRTYSKEVRELILRRINEIAKGMAKTAGAPEPTVNVVESAPVLITDQLLTERFRKAVTRELGEGTVIDTPPLMASEDFGLFAQTIGARNLFYWIGASNPKDPTIANHSPKFAPDFKTLLPTAVKSMVAGLLDLHSPTATPILSEVEAKKKRAAKGPATGDQKVE